MSRAWMEAQPWLVASTMLVPGRAAFGWIAPATVDVLLPEWYRKDDGTTILPEILDTTHWELSWLDSLGRAHTEMYEIFKPFPAWFFIQA